MSKPLARARIGALVSGTLAILIGVVAVLLSTGAFVWRVGYAAESFLYNTFGALVACTVMFWATIVCLRRQDVSDERTAALHADVKGLRTELQRIRRAQIADARGDFTDSVVRHLGLVDGADRANGHRAPAARRPTD